MEAGGEPSARPAPGRGGGRPAMLSLPCVSRLRYLRTPVPVQRRPAPPSKTTTTVIPRSRPAAAPQAVVVGDMMVAEDSDSDVIEEEFDGDDDPDDKPKVLRVISRSRPSPSTGSAVSKVTVPEPSWHALLRRTASSRTASIARSLPRAPAPARPAAQPAPQPALSSHGTLSRIVRARGPQRPAVNVPAKVLVPRSRLVLTSRLLPAGAHVRLPLTALGGGVVYGGAAGAAGKAGVPIPVRRDQFVRGLTGRIIVSAVGPLSPAESAVLDGVVDMEAEREAQWGTIWAYMKLYGVKGSDNFPDDFLA